MALSQLRPFVIEGDRPAPDAQPGFTKLSDGSLIMRGTPKAAMEEPGFFSGLKQWARERLNPAPAQPPPFWLPEPVSAAPAATPAPAMAGPGTPLPAYNDPFTEIAAKVAERDRVAEELGPVSSNIMNNERLIQGKWFSPNVPKRVE